MEQIETAAGEWAKAASTKEANRILTTLTAIFKLAQRYGPLRGKANAAELAERALARGVVAEPDCSARTPLHGPVVVRLSWASGPWMSTRT